MKKIIPIVIIAVLIIMVAFVFVGCKKKDGEFNLVKEGTLTVATNAEFAPFEYLDNGKPAGIDMDIAKEIADKMGLNLAIEDMAFDSVVIAVSGKKADIAMAGLTITEDRKKSVLFSNTYYTSEQVVIAKKGDPILSKETAEEVRELLKNKKLGAQNGTTGFFYASGDEDWGYDAITGATAEGFTSGTTAVLSLKNKQIDYVIIDRLPANALAKNNPDIEVSKVSLTEEDYAFAVQLGNTKLQEKVNEILADIVKSGKFEEIFRKHTLEG